MRELDNPTESKNPLFSYLELGGEAGLRRWLYLNQKHGRFIRPATMRPLFAGMVETTKLMELYAAIEYYVAASKREKRNWAPRGNLPPAITLTRHASVHFKKFVGDSEKWATKVHELYNQIKHDPVDVDPVEAHWFAESARVLIISVALDYASRRSAASRQYLADYRLKQIGEEIRSRVA